MTTAPSDDVQCRALSVLEAHTEELSAAPLLYWLAVYRSDPHPGHGAMLEDLSSEICRAHGTVVSAAFEALAFPERRGIRQRFEALEGALREHELARLPPSGRPH